jgi:putative ABC transport system substrate-binding protein
MSRRYGKGCNDLGHIEGKSFVIEYRGAEGKLDRIPNLVNGLVQLKVDALVVPILSAILSAREATKTIPVVMVTGIDPVATGLVDSLARPGGNITGLATLAQDLSGKRLELLKELVPRLSRVGVLQNPYEQTAAIAFKEYEAAARVLKIQLQSIDVSGSNPDLERAFQTAAKVRAGGLITVTTAALFLQRKRIAELAIKNRLPSLYQGSAWVEAGGLMSYSTDDLAIYCRAATYVDKILKGTKPADLRYEKKVGLQHRGRL